VRRGEELLGARLPLGRGCDPRREREEAESQDEQRLDARVEVMA